MRRSRTLTPLLLSLMLSSPLAFAQYARPKFPNIIPMEVTKAGTDILESFGQSETNSCYDEVLKIGPDSWEETVDGKKVLMEDPGIFPFETLQANIVKEQNIVDTRVFDVIEDITLLAVDKIGDLAVARDDRGKIIFLVSKNGLPLNRSGRGEQTSGVSIHKDGWVFPDKNAKKPAQLIKKDDLKLKWFLVLKEGYELAGGDNQRIYDDIRESKEEIARLRKKIEEIRKNPRLSPNEKKRRIKRRERDIRSEKKDIDASEKDLMENQRDSSFDDTQEFYNDESVGSDTTKITNKFHAFSYRIENRKQKRYFTLQIFFRPGGAGAALNSIVLQETDRDGRVLNGKDGSRPNLAGPKGTSYVIFKDHFVGTGADTKRECIIEAAGDTPLRANNNIGGNANFEDPSAVFLGRFLPGANYQKQYADHFNASLFRYDFCTEMESQVTAYYNGNATPQDKDNLSSALKCLSDNNMSLIQLLRTMVKAYHKSMPQFARKTNTMYLGREQGNMTSKDNQRMKDLLFTTQLGAMVSGCEYVGFDELTYKPGAKKSKKKTNNGQQIIQ